MNKKIIYYFVPTWIFSILLPFLAIASAEANDPVGVWGLIMEYGILVLLIIGVLVMRNVLKKFGDSMMGKLFTYFSIGTILLVTMRIFIHLVELNFVSISFGALHFYWHIIFYLALVSFYFGLKGLVDLADGKDGEIPNMINKWKIFSIISIFLIFVLSITTGSIYDSFYNSSIFESFGLHHFIAFALSVILSYYLIQSRKKIGMIGSGIATPFILSLSLFGLQHFWELLTESWKFIIVEEEIIEHVEQYIVIIAVFLLVYTFIQLKKITSGNQARS